MQPLKNNVTAKPLLPYLKNYPLVNELVLIFLVPDKDISENSNSKSYFYLNPISVWNNQHINAYPNTLEKSPIQPTQKNHIRQ